MNHLDFVKILFLCAFSGLTFIGLGRRLVGKLDSVQNYGVSLALGIVIWGYLAMTLGVLKIFTQTNLFILLFGAFIFGFYNFKWEKIKIKIELFSLSILLFASAMLASTYLMTMQPPHTSDELNYHFPQAQWIVDSKRVDLTFGGHFFYGNIPKQMEIIYASAIAMSGYPLAHAYHFLFLIALLLSIWGIFYKQYGIRVASIAVFMLLMYDDLTWNITSGFVDGAAFSLEIMGLLYGLSYITGKAKIKELTLAGLLIGAGLTIKYSVAVTAFYIFILLIPQWKKIWYYILPAALIGGFWYLKNMLWFGNPFYPMYFGHLGANEEMYKAQIDAIQAFGPKTWGYFKQLMSYFRDIPRMPVYLSLLLSPLSLVISKSAKFTRLLFLYLLLYVPYWFYLGTHQHRFFAPAVITALLLTAIILGQIRAKWLVVVGLVVTLFMVRTAYFNQTVASYFWSTKFHLRERQYGLGNLSQDEFMHRWYGCYYDISRYMNSVEGEGKVTDNWSLGVEFNIPFYSVKHQFLSTNDLNTPYMYYRDETKVKYSDIYKSNILKNQKYEDEYKAKAILIKTIDDCYLYQRD